MTPQALYALSLLLLPVVNPNEAQAVAAPQAVQVNDINAWLVAHGYPLPGENTATIPAERWRALSQAVPAPVGPNVIVVPAPAFAGPRLPAPTQEELEERHRLHVLNRLLNDIDGSPWWRNYVGPRLSTPY